MEKQFIQRRKFSVRVAIALVLSVTIQLFWFYTESVPYLFLIQLMSGLLCFCLPEKEQGYFHSHRLWAVPFAFLSLIFPVVGPCIGLLLLLLSPLLPEQPTLDKESEIPDVLERKISFGNSDYDINGVERISSDTNILPLQDILLGTDISLIRGAIEKLSQLKDRESLNSLLSLRSHFSPEVRFFVTSSLTKVKKEFDDELETAKKEVIDDFKNKTARKILAMQYLRYIDSGLLDPETQKSFMEEAKHHLSNLTSERFEIDVEVWRERLFLHLKNEEWQAALDDLETIEKKEGYLTVKENETLLELLYKLGRYDLMKMKLKEMLHSKKIPQEWESVYDWWGNYAH